MNAEEYELHMYDKLGDQLPTVTKALEHLATHLEKAITASIAGDSKGFMTELSKVVRESDSIEDGVKSWFEDQIELDIQNGVVQKEVVDELQAAKMQKLMDIIGNAGVQVINFDQFKEMMDGANEPTRPQSDVHTGMYL